MVRTAQAGDDAGSYDCRELSEFVKCNIAHSAGRCKCMRDRMTLNRDVKLTRSYPS